MIGMVLALSFFGLCMVCVVLAPLALVHLVAEWWFRDGPGGQRIAAQHARIPAVRTCMGCDRPYDSAWDPIDFTPERARRDRSWMSGGLCPNCSGAD